MGDRPELEKANVGKRVVLVSNFLDAAKDDPDDEFGSILVSRMKEKGISMEVMVESSLSNVELCHSQVGIAHVWHTTHY